MIEADSTIRFDDPLDALIERARFVELTRDSISDSVADILTTWPQPEHSHAAAKAFVRKVGCDCPDPGLRRDIKDAAIELFARKGVVL
jgi:hypothetical protein